MTAVVQVVAVILVVVDVAQIVMAHVKVHVDMVVLPLIQDIIMVVNSIYGIY